MRPPYFCQVCNISESPNPCVHIEAALAHDKREPVKHITTMRDVDAARLKLNSVIEDLYAMQGKQYLPRLYAEVAAYRDYWVAQVERLLRAYHEQRSPAFLLRTLKHTTTCEAGDKLCFDCLAAQVLAAEAQG
jgi:hypothetical protein